MRGSHENGDIFFQHREACNKVYDALPAVVEKYMAKINAKLGTNYDLFNYYGAPDADRVIVAMGSICDVAEEVIDYLNATARRSAWSRSACTVPSPSSAGGPARDRQEDRRAGPHQGARLSGRASVPGRRRRYLARLATTSHLTGGRYGLGSKDTPRLRVRCVQGAGEGRAQAEFTIGIVDDVTNLSLPEVRPAPNTAAAGTIECKFWGLGGDGTVGATRTPSRSSATTPTSTSRHTSSMTPRRPAA